jgi:5-oxopent-3-ene-1,2,5-tricarboxylate decarboxylase / 2-hydroxyhepta-2,4-diene-1,7-dioate isomerase
MIALRRAIAPIPLLPGLLPGLPFAPYRLTGQVIGALMNDPAALSALGDAVHHPPYKAAPQAPVLYVKPRNTLATAVEPVVLPPGVSVLEVGAALGLVMGRTACRVLAADALAYVAGLVAVADLSVPHRSFYRPSVHLNALDGSCRLAEPVPLAAISPDSVDVHVAVDGLTVQTASTQRFTRKAAQLIADVSEFMTLHPGDVLLSGLLHGAPQVRAGQRATITLSSAGGLAMEMQLHLVQASP